MDLGPAADAVQHRVETDDSVWMVAWHPPSDPPEGTPYGANGVCVNQDGEVVVISAEGAHWDIPGGRPEGDETGEETLRREMLEEACATVHDARLLGFAQLRCIAGQNEGRVLVRSFWRADVTTNAWEPQFEIAHRRLLPPDQVLGCVTTRDGVTAMTWRALIEAGVLSR